MEDALSGIKSFVGLRYDGKVVEALVEACREGQIRAVGVYPKSPTTSTNNNGTISVATAPVPAPPYRSSIELNS